MGKVIIYGCLYQLKKRSLCLFILLLSFAPTAWSSEFGFSFREQYEIHDINYSGVDSDYKGFSNTFNFGIDKPFDISYGLALGSLASFSATKDEMTGRLGDSLEFYFVGLEIKYFPSRDLKGLFTRIGGYWDYIDTRSNIGKLNGWSYYAGVGWEFLWLNSIGIAPEIGIKQGDAEGLFYTSYKFGIGFQIYGKLND